MNLGLKKFIIRGSIFAFPIILFLGISSYVLLASGELESLDGIVEKLKYTNSPVQVGMEYSSIPRYIQLKMVQVRKPEVLVMGTSKARFIRAGFFKSPNTFYNSQLGGGVVEDYNIILNKIPINSQPTIILLGLNSEYFDNSCRFADVDTLEQEYSQEYARANPLRVWQYAFRQLYFDYFAGKFELNELAKLGEDPNKIGLSALIKGAGYLSDGSFVDHRTATDLLTHPRDESYKDVFNSQFFSKFSNDKKYLCPESHAYAINQVEEFLKTAEYRGIYVIGFIPPLATVINKQIAADKNFEYQKNLDVDLKPIFEKYKFGFYNFVDFSKIDPQDKEMIDAMHGSEKTMIRILISILNKEPALREYLDVNHLKNLLKNSNNNFYIF